MEAFDTADDRAFRKEVRAFFAANLSEEMRRAMLTGLPLGRDLSDRGTASCWPRAGLRPIGRRSMAALVGP